MGRIRAFAQDDIPLGKTMEAAATRTPPWASPPDGITEEELEVDTLLRSCQPDSFAPYSLRPEYNRESLSSRLDAEWCLKYGAREHERVKEKASSEATDRLVPGNFRASPPLQAKAAK